ncbi:hypothetical protein MTX26_10015 [Bradyrhizobium sp. ISRA443]|uniref:hypothetical protein n=1 Tax=unclassified Bradyrhizobium TaxID=2631580 RepID=UPI0024798FFD|nr:MULTISPECIES: hypothetical protein [unclassified Bradyrhizobium]WGS01121.1 hypothetical protein MTX23_10010 [Bradyrhizobium sp. ISRA436]WGS08008.1 hypothetical protein MTX18_10015 [Bradyrhizobium sp. ISRA437]WGS14896.1 hypothetical protein MTX26_10015 [Bradyrhizobium sp. ISRA443]
MLRPGKSSRAARQDISRQTGVELTVPALTPSRAIDSIVLQFSRKIRVASFALSAWIVRLHARLAPLLASWKWKTNPDDSALRAPDGPCCMKALPQLPCLHPARGQDWTVMRHSRGSTTYNLRDRAFCSVVLPGFNTTWNFAESARAGIGKRSRRHRCDQAPERFHAFRAWRSALSAMAARAIVTSGAEVVG